LRDWVFPVAVEDFGGSFSAEHAIGRRNQGMYARYTDAELRRLAAAFKTATSPAPLGAVELSQEPQVLDVDHFSAAH
jgi:hypothetical protein